MLVPSTKFNYNETIVDSIMIRTFTATLGHISYFIYSMRQNVFYFLIRGKSFATFTVGFLEQFPPIPCHSRLIFRNGVPARFSARAHCFRV